MECWISWVPKGLYLFTAKWAHFGFSTLCSINSIKNRSFIFFYILKCREVDSFGLWKLIKRLTMKIVCVDLWNFWPLFLVCKVKWTKVVVQILSGIVIWWIINVLMFEGIYWTIIVTGYLSILVSSIKYRRKLVSGVSIHSFSYRLPGVWRWISNSVSLLMW